MTVEDSIRQRIAELLKILPTTSDQTAVGEVYASTVSIATQLYGAGSPQVNAVDQIRKDMQFSKLFDVSKAYYLTQQCHGMLKSFASDIDSGRLRSLRLEYQGQIFADLINAAKAAIASGSKDVASVLACAALEDSLKRYAEANGLNVDDAEMSTVINSLKSKGFLTSQQSALLKGMVPLRNKALHAEWSKVDETSVQSVIAFVTEFLLKHF